MQARVAERDLERDCVRDGALLDYRSYVWRGQGSAGWPLEQTLDRILRLSLYPDLYGASRFSNLDLMVDNY